MAVREKVTSHDAETGTVLTVYLDQNKWIDLARAATGHPRGKQFEPLLEELTAAARDGRARFPLSLTHYLETGKKADRKKRMELATTMLTLAGHVRIAPAQRIVPWEIRRAMVEEFDLDVEVQDIEIFGDGVAHAAGSEDLSSAVLDRIGDLALPEDVRVEVERSGRAAYEAMILADVLPAGVSHPLRDGLRQVRDRTDARFVEGQRDVADAILEHGRHRLADIMLATAYSDIRLPIAEAAFELGLQPPQVVEHIEGIIRRTSSRWVEMKLRHQRQANSQIQWQGNDLNDVIALSIAVPYCDVVVTERSWSSMINAAKANERFGTTVTPRLRDVLDMLA